MWKEYNTLFPHLGWKVADAQIIEKLGEQYVARTHLEWTTIVDFPDVKVLYWGERKAYFIAVKVEA